MLRKDLLHLDLFMRKSRQQEVNPPDHNILNRMRRLLRRPSSDILQIVVKNLYAWFVHVHIPHEDLNMDLLDLVDVHYV